LYDVIETTSGCPRRRENLSAPLSDGIDLLSAAKPRNGWLQGQECISGEDFYCVAPHRLKRMTPRMAIMIIEIKPYAGGGWQVFAEPGTAPFWTGDGAKESAVEYAMEKCQRHRGEIRLVNADGEIEKTIPFDDSREKKAG
jgi:hypothetical protein